MGLFSAGTLFMMNIDVSPDITTSCKGEVAMTASTFMLHGHIEPHEPQAITKLQPLLRRKL